MTKVHVAICKKVDPRDAAHWLLWLEAPDSSNYCLQTGDDMEGVGYYVEKVLEERPDTSSSLDETILCGTVPAAHVVSSVIERILQIPVNNKSTRWNCQDWVLSALDVLTTEYGVQVDHAAISRLESIKENPEYKNSEAE